MNHFVSIFDITLIMKLKAGKTSRDNNNNLIIALVVLTQGVFLF